MSGILAGGGPPGVQGVEPPHENDECNHRRSGRAGKPHELVPRAHDLNAKHFRGQHYVTSNSHIGNYFQTGAEGEPQAEDDRGRGDSGRQDYGNMSSSSSSSRVPQQQKQYQDLPGRHSGQQGTARGTAEAVREQTRREFQSTQMALRENQARAVHGNLFRKGYPELADVDLRHQQEYHRPPDGKSHKSTNNGAIIGAFQNEQKGGRRSGWNMGVTAANNTTTIPSTGRVVNFNTKTSIAQQKIEMNGACAKEVVLGEPVDSRTRTSSTGSTTLKPPPTTADQSSENFSSAYRRFPVPAEIRNLLTRLRSFLLRPASRHTQHDPMREFGKLVRTLRNQDATMQGFSPPNAAIAALRSFFPSTEFSSKILNDLVGAFYVEMEVDPQQAQTHEHVSGASTTFGLGGFDHEAFIYALRPTLTRAQRKLIDQTFDALDTEQKGYLTLAEVKRAYHPRNDPRVVGKTHSPHLVWEEFVHTFDAIDDATGILWKQRFLEYYQLHAELLLDYEFAQLLRGVWLPTGHPDQTAQDEGPFLVEVQVPDSATGGGHQHHHDATAADSSNNKPKTIIAALRNDLGLNRELAADVEARLHRQGLPVRVAKILGHVDEEELSSSSSSNAEGDF
ncbi:unnamed protein product [Amoebophrya sp. A25]|nr:unnamed protein product [Amoebophrya sp. A25]|eukprot:GSA25T00000667001.1